MFRVQVYCDEYVNSLSLFFSPLIYPFSLCNNSGIFCKKICSKMEMLITRAHTSMVKRYKNEYPQLNPFWVTGFCDAEGCFSISISQRRNLNWRVIASFDVNLHIKDVEILYILKQFFGVGNVTLRPKKSNCVYRVTKIKDLISVIIPHFLKYSLITIKYSDFILWSKVVNLIYAKKHLTSAGFKTILSYFSSINRGISKKVSSYFSNVPVLPKINPDLPLNLNPFWVSGFTAGDGDFLLWLGTSLDKFLSDFPLLSTHVTFY